MAGQSSFWISRNAWEILKAKAKGNEILAYLVLAYFTDRSGEYSTAGVNAVYKYTGLSKQQTENAIQGLLSIKNNDDVPIIEDLDAGNAKNEKRYRLELFDDAASDGIWIGGGLITGSYRGRKYPLSMIKSVNYDGMIIKALIELYRFQDEHYAGVDPKYIRGECAIEEAAGLPEKGIATFIATPNGITISDDFYIQLLQYDIGIINPPYLNSQKKRINEAINFLIRNGFIYRAYCVLDDPDFLEGQVLGCLHVEHKSKGEQGLMDTIKDTNSLAAANFREVLGQGKYPVILQQGIMPSALGIFRLRYRVANPKNAGVSATWARFKNNDEEFKSVAIKLLPLLTLANFRKK